MKLNVNINRLVDKPESSVKAVASVTFDNAFAVHGIKIVKSKSGLFTAMPNTKHNDKYHDIFHAITKEARNELNEAVMQAYEKACLE